MALTDEAKTRLGRAVRKVEGLPSGVVSPRIFDGSGGGAPVPQFAKVVSSTPIGVNKWSYTVQPVVWNAETFTFQNSGDQVTDVLNLNEWYNSGGDCGNGVRAGNLPGNFAIKPASVGTPLVVIMTVPGSEVPPIVFQHTNGVDGVCS